MFNDSLQNLQRLSQHLLTFALFSTQQFSDVFVCFTDVVVEFNCSVVAFQCLFEPTDIIKCKTKVIMSINIFGVEFEDCVVAVYYIFVFAEMIECQTEFIMSFYIFGIECEDCLETDIRSPLRIFRDN